MPDPANLYHLVLLRHGESSGNAEGLLQGQADFPLNPTGRRQVQALVARWRDEGLRFDRILSSPLLRARQTAEGIAATLHAPVELDPAWMERDYGRLTGHKAAELAHLSPPVFFVNPYIPFGETGESRWELYLRAGKAIQALVRLPPGRYLVVSHGGLLNMCMYAILGIVPQPHNSGARFRFSNTGFASLVYNPADHAWQLRSFDDQAHWRGAKTEKPGLVRPTSDSPASPEAPLPAPAPPPDRLTIRPAVSQDKEMKTMTIEFRSLQPAELNAWFDHCALSFGQDGLDPRLREMCERSWVNNPRKDFQGILVAVEAGKILSGLLIEKHRLYLCGSLIPMGGIALVGTRSEARRQGLSTRLLEQAIRQMEAWDMKISLLQTGVHPHYRKLGWETVPFHWKTLRTRPGMEATCLIRPLDFATDLAQAASLHAAYTGRLNGPVLREPERWHIFTSDPPGRWWVAETQGRLVAYLCLDNWDNQWHLVEFGAYPEGEALFDSFVCGALEKMNPPVELIACPAALRSQLEIVGRNEQNHWMARLIRPFEVAGQRLEGTQQLIDLLSGNPQPGETGAFTFWSNEGF
jgi:probable phosphoglycerate mutase